ncbi:MAG: hypothetical protein ABL958_08540 [Bdellovibrionia bacterium]
MTYLYSLKRILFYVAAAFALLGSAAQASDEWKFRNWSPRDVAGFEKTTYVFAKKQCAVCHGDTQAPLFAVKDVNVAYAAAKPYADFANPAKSRLYAQSMNGHCNLSYCKTDGKEMLASITEWAKSETPVSTRIKTKSIAMPQLSMTEYRAISWNLSETEPAQAGMGNARIQVEAILFSADSVLFRRPRVVGNTTPVYMKDLALEINGEIIQKGKYENLERVVMPSTTPPVLSVDKILIPYTDGLKIGLSLSRVQVSQALTSCSDLEKFQANVYPVMVDRECFYCHGGGPKNYPGEMTAMKTFDTRGTLLQLCLASQQRSHQATPLKSPIIWYALGNEAGHPRMIPYVDDIQPEWIDWIKAIVWKARQKYDDLRLR